MLIIYFAFQITLKNTEISPSYEFNYNYDKNNSRRPFTKHELDIIDNPAKYIRESTSSDKDVELTKEQIREMDKILLNAGYKIDNSDVSE